MHTLVCLMVVSQVLRFFFLSFCKLAIDLYSDLLKRCLLLGRKAMTNLTSVLKNRDITLHIVMHIDKGAYSQSYDFSSSLVQI